MAAKMEVVLLQAVKWLGLKNEIVSVAIPYAKNVLFAKWLAKQADASAKQVVQNKHDQEKKHQQDVATLRDTLHTYIGVGEPLIIKRKVTPSGSLYEKVHETDVKQALQQWSLVVPADITITKNVRDTVWEHHAEIVRWNKKQKIPFTIKESYN